MTEGEESAAHLAIKARQTSTMSAGVILYGETTRELYGAWHARVGATATIPQSEIQPLFNDIALYPCTSQVRTTV